MKQKTFIVTIFFLFYLISLEQNKIIPLWSLGKVPNQFKTSKKEQILPKH